MASNIRGGVILWYFGVTRPIPDCLVSRIILAFSTPFLTLMTNSSLLRIGGSSGVASPKVQRSSRVSNSATSGFGITDITTWQQNPRKLVLRVFSYTSLRGLRVSYWHSEHLVRDLWYNSQHEFTRVTSFRETPEISGSNWGKDWGEAQSLPQFEVKIEVKLWGKDWGKAESLSHIELKIELKLNLYLKLG